MHQSAYAIEGEGPALAGVAFHPVGDADGASPVIVLCHWLPKGRWDEDEQEALEAFGSGLAEECGVPVVAFNFRGIGESEGDFGIGGWCIDLRNVIETLSADSDFDRVWLVGVGIGGAVALSVASGEVRVAGVVAIGAPAEFAPLNLASDTFLVRARATDLVRSDAYPEDPHAWRRELIAFAPVHHLHRFAPRPALVVHGSRDEAVPRRSSDQLVEAGGSTFEKVVIPGGDDLYRHQATLELVARWLRTEIAG